MSVRTYRIADLFCGAGGSSTGAIRAIRAMGADVVLVAVKGEGSVQSLLLEGIDG